MTDQELDALVAEKVMGWERRGGAWVPEKWDDPSSLPPGVITTQPHFYFWKPSTDIAAAWMVVEKMNCDFRFDWNHGEGVYCASFGTNKYVGCDNKSPARAICLAALKAVGVQVKA